MIVFIKNRGLTVTYNGKKFRTPVRLAIDNSRSKQFLKVLTVQGFEYTIENSEQSSIEQVKTKPHSRRKVDFGRPGSISLNTTT